MQMNLYARYRAIFACYLCLCILSGCKVLNNTQREAALHIAAGARKLALVPTDLHSKIYEIQLDGLNEYNYVSFTYNHPDTAFRQLQRIEIVRDSIEKIVRAFDAQYTVLACFADMLLALTDETYTKQFSQNQTRFKESLEDAVALCDTFLEPAKKQPVSLAALISGTVDKAGQRFIKRKQLVFTRQFIDSCQTYVFAICDHILRDVANLSRLERGIIDVDQSFRTHFERLKSHQAGVLNVDYIQKNVVPFYREKRAKKKMIHELLQSIPAGIRVFKKAYTDFDNSLHKKLSVAELKKTIKELSTPMGDLRKIYSTYKKDLEEIQRLATPSK